MKNNTPRTQEVVNRIADNPSNLQPIFDLCRLLECELQAFKRNNDELIFAHNALVEKRDTLSADLAMRRHEMDAALRLLFFHTENDVAKNVNNKVLVFVNNIEAELKTTKNELAACDHHREMIRSLRSEITEIRGEWEQDQLKNAALRQAAVEVCALARVWVTVWGDQLSGDSVRRFSELEQQILRRAKP